MTAQTHMSRCTPVWMLSAALLLITLIVYIPSYRAGFIWDDDYYVTKNHVLRNAEGLHKIWFDIGATPQYYPLVYTTFWAEFHAYGLNPFGYHLVNIILHGFSAVLLFITLRRLNVSGAWLGAALFAIHPVQVESVSWITERKNILSGFFYLSAMLAYLEFDARQSSVPADATTKSSPRLWYIVAILSFLFALLSKTVTATLPAAILLVVYWLRGRIVWRDWLRTAPMFTMGLGFAMLTAWMERKEVGAEGHDWNFSIIERFLIAGRACWFYLGKLLWPHPLIFVYPRWEINDRVWWQCLFPLAAIALPIILWRGRSRWSRGPLIAMLYFGGTLLPALGFANVYPMRFSFVADHFQYLACIGPLALIGSGLFLVAARIGGASAQRFRPVTAMVVLLIAAVLAWRQQAIYRDIRGLWEDTLAKNPGAWMAHGNLAMLLTEQGRVEEALPHAEFVLRTRPDLPSTHVNYGDILIRAHRPAEAEAAYRRALQLDVTHLKANFELGNLLVETGRAKEAIEHLLKAVRREPEFPSGHYRLAIAYERAGDLTDAISHYRRALEIKSRFPEAMYYLARAHLQINEPGEAVVCFRKAIAMRPNYLEAYNDLATTLASGGDNAGAIQCLQEAVRLKTDYRLARLNLATLLAGQGRTAEAKEHLQAILRDHPNDPDAKKALEGLARPPATQGT